MHVKTLSDWMRAPVGGTLDTELFGLEQRVATLELKYVDLKRREQCDRLYEQYIIAKAVGKTHKRWISKNGKNTRASHRAVNRRLIPIDEYFIVGGERLFPPGDPSALFAETTTCSCTFIFEPVTATLPTVSEMLEYESQKKPKSDRDDYVVLQSGLAFKERSVWTNIPKNIKRVRVRVFSMGDALRPGGKVPKGNKPKAMRKIIKTTGNAGNMIFSRGARTVENIPLDLEPGKTKDVIRSAPAGFHELRVTVWGRSFAPLTVTIEGSRKPESVMLGRPRR